MASIQSGPDGLKQKAIRTEWPVEEGLEGGTNKQEGRTTNLVTEKESLVPEREKVGF
tara:strand:+ start:233 stop:403 length:171 start_codon:yes stop_codon:yes gene_type:complete